MRRTFDGELQSMHGQFTKMGLMVNENILRAVKAFINHDKNLAMEAKKKDKDINEIEVAIENFCFQLIALQQPVSSDLRSIVMVMKASSDLERMGDHAVSIARSVIRVKERHNKRIPEVEAKIAEMAEIVKSMVEQVIDAYVRVDEEDAYRIAQIDSEVDKHFVEINHYCIKQMAMDPEVVPGGSDYIAVAGYLERIGDYVTNICERIVYLKTGEILELN
ncbi:phosphate signaling complex protein PhoU [Jeotgalibaca ciconiae]|uniref:Phosphate-specific transport system accessory protein PhoU n=1 Tax=Jeotgalibaca ciconiae TaxID=2496265 RepID=A0A3Q9BKM7_9LACT|nr:phosphate signaling complex protein PhoU [Jeotgalibaca ciconiae]AZP04596.1 phosphate signaling complex protein PhoU [Jeotgalibaca ciconiae]HJB23355.1 phosphate signaling complex protein PhoU [Candidatus Jeotgalibaca pullicola]